MFLADAACCCLLTNIHGKYSWIQRYSRGCGWHRPAAVANKSSDKSALLWKSTNPEFGNPHKGSAQMLVVENCHKSWQCKIGTKTQLGLSCPIATASFCVIFSQILQKLHSNQQHLLIWLVQHLMKRRWLWKLVETSFLKFNCTLRVKYSKTEDNNTFKEVSFILAN